MRTLHIVIVLVAALVLQGCATVFKGYYSKVELLDAPDSLKVYTTEGIELPVERTTKRIEAERTPNFRNPAASVYIDRPAAYVQLRSKYDQILVLRNVNEEKKVQAFGKIGAGWLILGTALGVVPAAVDALTGNWNSYDPIDASFKPSIH